MQPSLSHRPLFSRPISQRWVFALIFQGLALASALDCTSSVAHADEPHYSVTNLGNFIPTALNNLGQVVGGADSAPVFYSNGVVTPLTWAATAQDINDQGQIVGSFFPTGVGHAYIYSTAGGVLNDVGATAGGNRTFFNSINNLGKAVGAYNDGYEHGYIYPAVNPVFTVNYPGLGDQLLLSSISDSGDMAGYSVNTSGMPPHALFFPVAGGEVDLGPGYSSGGGEPRVNLHGQVSFSSTVGGLHAFEYSAGVFTPLDTAAPGAGPQHLPLTYSLAKGISNTGDIVGEAGNNSGGYAFLYHNNQMLDLNSLIAPTSGWILGSAVDVNDLGQVVGYGTDPNGNLSAFLLTPVPEPSSSALAAMGAVAFAGYLARRARRP